MNDWTPVGRPLAHPISAIICPHWLLARQPSQNGPMIVAPYAPGHSSLLLKSPPHLQWRLSPFTYFLSPSALSPLLLTSLYSLILCPSFPSSSFSLHHLYFFSSSPPSGPSLSVSPSLLSTPCPACAAALVQTGVCWTEGKRCFYLFIL